MSASQPVVWLYRWERLGMLLMLPVLVAWGCVVEVRSAFLERRMTDVSCFFRAAWAVRTGESIYDIVEENSWHYNYPPLFAILMTPLADAPVGEPRPGMLPYEVSVILWYVASLAFLAIGIHSLASALQDTSTDPRMRDMPRWSRRWWYLRSIPFFACLAPIGHSLTRGQTNTLLLMLLCLMAAATLRGRRWLSGVWLAGAIVLKVYPVFLLLYPLWRRDRGALAGCAAGLFVGLALVPAAVFGLPRTTAYYQQYAEVLLGPALGLGSDRSRAQEIIESTANDTQSIQGALHNSLHLERATRPKLVSPAVRWTARFLSVALTLLTLAAAGWRQQIRGPAAVLLLGALTLVMLFSAPVCHTHYFCLQLLVVMGLVAAAWERRAGILLGAGLVGVVAVNWVVYIVEQVFEWPLRDLAVMLYPTLLLWLIGTVVLWRLAKGSQPAAVAPPVAWPAEAAA